MGKPYPSQIADRFLLRLPDGMRDRIANAARANQRTMTAEIVLRLQRSLDTEDFEMPAFLRPAPPEEAPISADKDGLVLHLTITPGMTVDEVLELLEAANMALPEGTRVVAKGPG
jgi:hypothetical protein